MRWCRSRPAPPTSNTTWRPASPWPVASRAIAGYVGGVLAVDILEHPERGPLVGEVNYAVEFRDTLVLVISQGNQLATVPTDLVGKSQAAATARILVPWAPLRAMRWSWAAANSSREYVTGLTSLSPVVEIDISSTNSRGY